MKSPWSSRSPTAPRAATSSSPLRPSSRPRWPPASPSRSRKRFATTRNFARSLRPSRPTPSSSSPTGASFRPGCSRCPGWAASTCTPSLLPRYRGAAPIQWAVAMGDAFTGNTTMLLEEGLDTGPILLQQAFEIAPEQTAADLFDRAGPRRRAADGRNPGRPGQRNHPAHSRRTTPCATFAPLLDARRRAHGFCRAHGHGTQESLARLSALARRFHRARRQKAHRSPHGSCRGRRPAPPNPAPAEPGQIRIEDHRLFVSLRRKHLAGTPRSPARRQKAPHCSRVSARNRARPPTRG